MNIRGTSNLPFLLPIYNSSNVRPCGNPCVTNLHIRFSARVFAHEKETYIHNTRSRRFKILIGAHMVESNLRNCEPSLSLQFLFTKNRARKLSGIGSKGLVVGFEYEEGGAHRRFRTHIDKYSKSGGARRPRKHVFRIPRNDLYRSSIGLLSWDHPLGTPCLSIRG